MRLRLSRNSASARTRKLASRTLQMKSNLPEAVNGLSLISTGSSFPSLRRPKRVWPVPVPAARVRDMSVPKFHVPAGNASRDNRMQRQCVGLPVNRQQD